MSRRSKMLLVTVVAVATFKPHISRARIIVQRCFDGELDMLAVTTPLSLIDWMYQFAYQNAADVKVALTPGR